MPSRTRQIDKTVGRTLFLELPDQVDILLLDECQLDFTELWPVPVELLKILAHLLDPEFAAPPRVDLVAGGTQLLPGERRHLFAGQQPAIRIDEEEARGRG